MNVMSAKSHTLVDINNVAILYLLPSQIKEKKRKRRILMKMKRKILMKRKRNKRRRKKP